MSRRGVAGVIAGCLVGCLAAGASGEGTEERDASAPAAPADASSGGDEPGDELVGEEVIVVTGTRTETPRAPTTTPAAARSARSRAR